MEHYLISKCGFCPLDLGRSGDRLVDLTLTLELAFYLLHGFVFISSADM